MLAPFALDIYRDDLAGIVQSVFLTMMNLEAACSPAEWIQMPDTITSTVQFTGAWQGAVLVESSAAEACQFAARFMGIDPPETVDDDVRDVAGELANMVAGNLKSLLPKGVDISMPCVVEGKDYVVHCSKAGATERLTLACELGMFRVTLIEFLQPA